MCLATDVQQLLGSWDSTASSRINWRFGLGERDLGFRDCRQIEANGTAESRRQVRYVGMGGEEGRVGDWRFVRGR